MKLVELSKTEFNEFTNYLEICPFEQSIYWANFKSGENWHPYFLGLEDKNKLLGATLLLANENKSIKKRFFYAPQGFLIDYKNYDLLEVFTKEIINFVKEKNGIYLKIDPEILTTEKDEDGRELQGGINNLFIKDYLLKLGFIETDNNTLNPKYTMKLDLTDKSLNDILNNMSKKARQIIKRNERLGYIVRELKQDELPIFIKTMDKISSKFNTIEYELPFYEDLASAFTKEHLKIMIAELDLNTTLNNLKKEEKVLQIEKEKELIDKNLNQVELLRNSLESDLSNHKQKEKEILEKAKKEARQILLDAKAKATNIIKDLNELSESNTSLKHANNLRNQLNTSLKDYTPSLGKTDIGSLTSKDITIGMTVLVKTLNTKAIVLSLPNKSNEVQLQIGNAKTTMNINKLEKANAEKQSSTYTKKSINLKSKNISSEINVIGQNVDEAIFVIDKYLDDCSLAKISPVRIVHGKGTGKLRQGIHTFLKTNPHVKSFRLGTFGEGEMGVTIVEIK